MSITELRLPEGMTATALMAQLNREMKAEDDARRAAEEARAAEARAQVAARNREMIERAAELTQRYLEQRQAMLSTLVDLYAAHMANPRVVSIHPSVWKINLPSLDPKDPSNPNFSTFECIHASKGARPVW